MSEATVAGVARAARRLPVPLVAEMLAQLRLQRPLHQPLRQPGEHAARPDDLLLRAGAGEQLVDHLIREPVPQLPWELDLRRGRAADRSLRSPSGLAPQPASAIDSSV